MKCLLKLICAAMLLSNPALSQEGKTPVGQGEQIDTRNADSLTKAQNGGKGQTAPDSDTSGQKKAEVRGQGCAITPNQLYRLEWLLIFSPMLVFLALLGLFMLFKLRQFNMDAALSENEYPKIVIPNTNFTPVNFQLLSQSVNAPSISEALPSTIEISDHPLAMPVAAGATPAPPRPSISRYIALISTLLTLVIAVCLTCFYLYHYMRHNCAPDLSGSTGILLALGLGVLPYAVNKASSAFKKSEA